MESQLDMLPKEFQRQWVENPETANRGLLEQGKPLLSRSLERATWDFETVRAGFDLYFWLGDKRAIIDLMTRYLSQTLTVKAEAWARWNLVDNLAMTRRCEEAVKNQQDFLEWARHILPEPGWRLPEDWPGWPIPDVRNRPDTPADECLSFVVMYDGAQAFYWDEIGKTDDWLRIYHELLASVPATPCNRIHCRYYARSAGALMMKARRPDEGLKIAEQLLAVSKEDPAWSEAFEARIEAMCLEMDSYHLLQNVLDARRVGGEVTALLLNRQDVTISPEILRMLCHIAPFDQIYKPAVT